MNTHGIHMDIHAVLAQVRSELAELKHQEIHYGEMPSMLHLHMLCHALQRETTVYVEVNGKRHRVRKTYRPKDKIGRQEIAICLVAD